MAWDASRPVPWRRLLTEWLVVTVIVAVIFAFVVRATRIESYLGLFVGGAVYLGVGAVLAKFGYQRATLRSLREQRPAAPARPSSAAGSRPRPAPTRRTSTGPSQRPHRTNKSRRR
jgi:hypothetical protein